MVEGQHHGGGSVAQVELGEDVPHVRLDSSPAERQGPGDLGVAETLADQGEPADVLLRLAAECGADLLVIGNKGMERRLLGSVPNAVTHKADCLVLLVKTA